MSEQTEDTGMAVMTLDESDTGPPIESMPCYAGVPTEVVEECQQLYGMAKAVRLEALRRIRDRLAPWGNFNQWCHDHEENYGSVTYALSQAYGTVSGRPIKFPLIGGLLEGAPRTEEQTIIQAQAERLRVLEAQNAAYESRSPEEWLAETRRRAEEQGQERLADEAMSRIVNAVCVADPSLGQAVVDGNMSLAQALATLLLRDGVAPRPHRDGLPPSAYRAWLWGKVWWVLREMPEQSPSEELIVRVAAILEWSVDAAEAEHINEDTDVDGTVTPALAQRILRDGMKVPPRWPDQPGAEA